MKLFLLLLAVAITLVACGQYVLTETAETKGQPPANEVPTATRAERPAETELPTATAAPTATMVVFPAELPTATPFPPGFTGFSVIPPSGENPSVTVTGCSRPEGAALRVRVEVLEELEWVTDGESQGEDEAAFALYTIEDLITLAEECPAVFRALISLESMRVEAENVEWARWMVTNNMIQMARVNEDASLEVLRLPFLDTLEHLDGFTMIFLRDVFEADIDEALFLIATDEIANPETSSLPTDFYLAYLRFQGPAFSEALDSLQWLQDGLDPFWDEFDPSKTPDNYYESETMMAFTSLHLKSPRALLPMMRRPWLRESIDSMNYTALVNVLDFAYDSPEATAKIAQMDFLDTLERDDIRIIQELLEIKWDDRGRYHQILSDPALLEDHFSSAK